MNIRRGRNDDWSQVETLLQQIWQDDYVVDGWLEWVEHPERGVVLVAEQDGLVIGTCYVNFRSDQDCWFQAMRVHPGYRRLGVGSHLTEVALEEAKAAGRAMAYLGIDADNHPSLTMTERTGFRRTTDYLIFRSLTKSNRGDERQGWRQAVAEDLTAIIRLIEEQHARENTPRALFGCWEWQVLNEAACRHWIKQGLLWVWDVGEVKVTANIEIFADEAHFFAPSGLLEDCLEALGDFQAMAKSKQAQDLHLWLASASTLAAQLSMSGEYSHTPDDGYIIWQYDLTR